VARPAGSGLPPERRRSYKLTTHTTHRFAAACLQVATAEGRSLSSLVRVSLSTYCTPRLAAMESAMKAR
jgi:hypothetical protein